MDISSFAFVCNCMNKLLDDYIIQNIYQYYYSGPIQKMKNDLKYYTANQKIVKAEDKYVKLEVERQTAIDKWFDDDDDGYDSDTTITDDELDRRFGPRIGVEEILDQMYSVEERTNIYYDLFKCGCCTRHMRDPEDIDEYSDIPIIGKRYKHQKLSGESNCSCDCRHKRRYIILSLLM